MMKIATDTDNMYVFRNACVYQMLFTNVLSCIFLHCTIVIALLQYSFCSNTANINKLNLSFTIKFLVKIATK